MKIPEISFYRNPASMNSSVTMVIKMVFVACVMRDGSQVVCTETIHSSSTGVIPE